MLDVSLSKLLSHSPITTKNPPGSPSKLPIPAPKNDKIPPESSSKLPKPAAKIAKTPSDSSTKLPNHSSPHFINTPMIFGGTLPISSDQSPESPLIQPHPLTYSSAVLHTLLHQLAASLTKLPIHSPKAPNNLPVSKLSKPAPKPAKIPPVNTPKLAEHSPQPSINTPKIFGKTSPKSSGHSPETSPSLTQSLTPFLVVLHHSYTYHQLFAQRSL